MERITGLTRCYRLVFPVLFSHLLPWVSITVGRLTWEEFLVSESPDLKSIAFPLPPSIPPSAPPPPHHQMWLDFPWPTVCRTCSESWNGTFNRNLGTEIFVFKVGIGHASLYSCGHIIVPIMKALDVATFINFHFTEVTSVLLWVPGKLSLAKSGEEYMKGRVLLGKPSWYEVSEAFVELNSNTAKFNYILIYFRLSKFIW